MWDADALAARLAAGLARAARRLRRDRGAGGIDARREADLVPLVCRILRRAGHRVGVEELYPSDRGVAHPRDARRCDLVLRASGDGPDLWLEVKRAAEFTREGPARDYGARLAGPAVGDVGKLASDPGIETAALLLLLFTRDAAIAARDLLRWRAVCSEAGVPVSPPGWAGFDLEDRHGHGRATVALFPVRGALSRR